jgi:hypothetical protein
MAHVRKSRNEEQKTRLGSISERTSARSSLSNTDPNRIQPSATEFNATHCRPAIVVDFFDALRPTVECGKYPTFMHVSAFDHLGKTQMVWWAFCMLLKKLVGERGFEPPTPWSRTRFQPLLRLVEFYGFQVIAVEPDAGCLFKAVDSC